MRVFIAIELSGEARRELHYLQSSLKEAGADVKWVDPANIHLTLRFLGDCGEQIIPSVKTALTEAVSASGPFNLGLKGVGAFPGLSSPRIIWAGVGDGRRESEALYASISSRLAELGIPEEGRDFSPHITIGRVRSGKNTDSLRKAIERSSFPASSLTPVDSVVLFSSKLSPGGPIYTPLSKAMLHRP
ncbi:MAG: RNA 2',3'-cyclic phosphodiesterase [Candidatus Omnitrophota bacterium]